MATASPFRDEQAPRTRRTRFVCISDTHNATIKLPKGDVLIHAGDLTNQGSYSELCKAVAWLEKAPFERKIVIAGNHDLTLDSEFYASHGENTHQSPQDPEVCRRLLAESASITYLSHEAVTIRLTSPSGPRTTFTVFGSPYSPNQESGKWAFQYPRDSDEATVLWAAIPLETDLLITHTPPHHHCDEAVSRRKALGCETLRQAMWRVRPRLHVCGHVHEGRGAERITWELEMGNVPFAERGLEVWEDQSGNGSDKMSLIDLTWKQGRPLDNNGSHPTKKSKGKAKQIAGECDRAQSRSEGTGYFAMQQLPPCSSFRAMAHDHSTTDATTLPGPGTIGLGLAPGKDRSPARSDLEALHGRTGRRETCVVNCAIVATNYPHVGGRRYNKPIVVDVDLPVWETDNGESALSSIGRAVRSMVAL